MKATTLGGIRVEPGVEVILDSITLQRDPTVWGEDSCVFKIKSMSFKFKRKEPEIY
jgi:cytochrome P450